jgi:2-polyprenyl-6-methoxyphenol hydroxylase-like FAD-dependent oxidoreductase
MTTVLISGAGVAGPTLAHWLTRGGFDVTVVERARELRSSGNPVDVRGPAVAVVERMGLLPRLREFATTATALRFLDASGRTTGRIDLAATQRATGSREVELPRGDLARTLHEATRDDVEQLFDDTITDLVDDGHGVDVTFERAAPRRFDLVVGADGLHSAVRRLVFGPERDHVRHIGLHVATMPWSGAVGDGTEIVLHNTPGRLLSLHPVRGRALAAFIYRGPAAPGYDHRDTAQHKRLVAAAYADSGWLAPRLLAELAATDDLYFDQVSEVRMARWSRGRVVLLGDAASCVSLFGEGSSLAIAGAATLAEALSAHRADPAAAFARYETAHRALTTPKQRSVRAAAGMVVPATRLGLAARNAGARLWPLVTAAARLRRAISPTR